MRFEWLDGGFAQGEQASLDLGTLVADRAALLARAITVRRRVGVRVDGPGTAVRLSVALESDVPGWAVRLDGIALSTIPRIVTAVHRVGAAMVHQLEFTIPANVAPGPLLAHLRWIAEPI